MKRGVAAMLAAGAVVAGQAAWVMPAQAASEGQWHIVAYFSKPTWKVSKPKAQVLKACRTGTGGSPFALGTPVKVLDENDQVLGTAPVTSVKLWKESGRYICKFIAEVPVAPSPSNWVTVQVADKGGLMTTVGDVKADGWEVLFWPE